MSLRATRAVSFKNGEIVKRTIKKRLSLSLLGRRVKLAKQIVVGKDGKMRRKTK